MELVDKKYKRHIFVCINDKENEECCAKKNSEQILKILRQHVNENGLMSLYNITKTKCLGHCLEGPTIAVYPEGLIFKKVSIEDTQKIINEFLK
ncbi:MAG: (2Fe-2S) ferredoxin domain-containing protein [Nanoarchaeota archaeon]|mgnify:FL=1